MLTFHALSLSPLFCFFLLSFSPSRSEALQRWPPNGQHGSQHPPSSDQLSTANCLHHLLSSARTIRARAESAELSLDQPSTESRDKQRATGLGGVNAQQASRRVERTIELLGLHLKWNRLQWCLSNGTELLDMSGFINRIYFWDYDTLVHTSELSHFFQIGLWAKASNWKSPLERRSVLICCGGGGPIIIVFFLLFFFFWGTISKTPGFYPTNFPQFLSHCGEAHYEAVPFFFILPQWRRERRDRLSRIDNEQGDWHRGEEKEKENKKKEEGEEAENGETGGKRKRRKPTEGGEKRQGQRENKGQN